MPLTVVLLSLKLEEVKRYNYMLLLLIVANVDKIELASIISSAIEIL